MDPKFIELGETLRKAEARIHELSCQLEALSPDAKANVRLVQILGNDCPLVARIEESHERGKRLVIESKIDGQDRRYELSARYCYLNFVDDYKYDYEPGEIMAVGSFIDILEGHIECCESP